MKTSTIGVRVTESERALVERLSAELFGKPNLSKFIVKLIHNADGCLPIIKAEDLVAFKLANNQLTGIARNLNQITRKINAADDLKYLPTAKFLEELSKQVNNLKIELAQVINSNVR